MTLEQQTFITEYLRHRSKYTAYCLAYNPEDASDYNSVMSAADTLMDDPEGGGVIKSVIDGIRHEVAQEMRAEFKTELLTVQSKRELLARIARGEMTAVQHYKGKDCNHCSQLVLPTINQMLRAIDLDNRMMGHYPEPKQQLTVNNQQQELSPEACPQHSWRGGGVRRTGVEHSHRTENTTELQQSTTIKQSPLPGRGLGEAYSNQENNTTELQQSTTIKQSPLPGEGWVKPTHAGQKTLPKTTNQCIPTLGITINTVEDEIHRKKRQQP